MPIKRYKNEKAKADELFSKIIRSEGECEAKGFDGINCSNQLQTAHIITRKRAATRTDLRNAFCCCFAHHRYFTDYPRQFSRFITTTRAQEYYEDLYAKSTTLTKVDWAERVVFLKDIYEQINRGELTLDQARLYES